MNKQGIIYLIENKINGKKYIGQTILTLEKRWHDHKEAAKSVKSNHRPLYKDMNEFGIENFLVAEIEKTDDCNEREKYWIKYFDSYYNGYNRSLGGGSKYNINQLEFSDQEIITKFNELKTVKATADFFKCGINSISLRLKKNKIEIPGGGNIHDINRSYPAKRIKQFLKNNEYLRSFPSIRAAARWIIENGFSKSSESSISSNICRVVNNSSGCKSSYGFIWKEEKEEIIN